jgi:ribosomal protein S6--L-glutamate ligase
VKKNEKLRIGILMVGDASVNSPLSKPSYPAIRLFREAIKKLGHTPVLYYSSKCQIHFYGRKSEILYANKKITPCDVLISRVGAIEDLDLEISLLKQFQMMGIPVFNEYLPVMRAKNKLRTLQILTKNNIPVPASIVVRKLEYLDESIKAIGGYPVILKTPLGTWGKGVALVESRRSLHSSLDILWSSSGANLFLIQEYIAEADGSDYRAFVLGDKVIGAVKRTAPKGDFRSNLHLGGAGVPVKLTDEEQRLAVRSAQALGLQMAGVDILRSKKGPLIMEVNSNPGITGITRVTGNDVAGEIIKFAIAFAKKKSKK